MYGTVRQLKEIAQVGVDDLHLSPAEGQTNEERLEELFEETLVAATDFINHDRRRDYEDEVNDGLRSEVPPGIINIALQLASNLILQLRQRQSARLMSKDDQTIEMIISAALTSDLRNALDLYPPAPASNAHVAGIGITRLRTMNPVTGIRD